MSGPMPIIEIVLSATAPRAPIPRTSRGADSIARWSARCARLLSPSPDIVGE